MASPNSWRALRAFIVCLSGLILIQIVFSAAPAARADTAGAGLAFAQGYDGETPQPTSTGPTATSYAYDLPTDTPESGDTLTPTLTFTITLTESVSRTPTLTFTITNTLPPGVTPSDTLQAPDMTTTPTALVTPTPPNIFLTEDAEIGGSKVTPPPSETPEDTSTATATLVPTRTRTPRPTIISGVDEGGIAMDWGLFWIGFSLPVMIICGVVLYLLDHRPEVFSFRK